MTSLPDKVDPVLEDADSGFWEDIVRDAILRFPRASAPGPSGLRPSHLQDSVRRRGRASITQSICSGITRNGFPAHPCRWTG